MARTGRSFPAITRTMPRQILIEVAAATGGSLASVAPTAGGTAVPASTTTNIKFTGSGTLWTIGAPTINAGAGSLSNQVVLDDTNVTYDFAAPTAQTVTFTDVTDGSSTTTIVVANVATTVNLTGPASGVVLTPSSILTAALPAGTLVAADTTVQFDDGRGAGVGFSGTVTLAKNTVATSGTFTYTPATVGVQTINKVSTLGSGTGLPYSYTATASALALGAITLGAELPTSIAMSVGAATGAAGSVTYQWGRWTSQVDARAFNLGTMTAVGTNSTSLTDSTPTPGVVYYYNVEATDASLTTVHSANEQVAATQGAKAVGWLGDEIPGYTTGGVTSPLANFAAIYPRLMGGRSLTVYDQTHAGAQLTDYNSGGTYDNAAVAAIPAGADVMCMLGMQDSRLATGGAGGGSAASHDRSVADFTAKMTTLANLWVGRGHKFIMHLSPWMLPNNLSSAGPSVLAGADDRLYAYLAAMQSIANGSTIVLGDTTAFQAFAANTSSCLADQVSPTNTGSIVLGQAWSVAQAKADGLLPSGGGSGGGGSMRLGL